MQGGWSQVWLQQTDPDKGLSFQERRMKTAGSMDPNEPLSVSLSLSLERIQRPTTCSMNKVAHMDIKRLQVPCLTDTTSGAYSWMTMKYYADVRRCLYNIDGAIKSGRKI